MVLIPRDAGIFLLTELPDLREDAADLVVLGDRLAQRVVGDIRAVDLVQRVQHLELKLLDVVADGVFGHLEGHVDERDEERVVLDDADQLEMLQRAVHLRARLGAHDGGEEVVPAFDAALQNGFAVVADEIRHVVGRNVQRAGERRAQTHGKAVAGVEQHLRHVIARVAHGVHPPGAGLLHEGVVRAFEQLLEFVEMFQVLQVVHRPFVRLVTVYWMEAASAR